MFGSHENFNKYDRIEFMAGLCLIVFCIILIKVFNPSGLSHNYKSYPGGSNEIVMYSLTTCGYCTQKREELKRERVHFTEYFIDKDRAKNDEMRKKLSAVGDNRNYITVPVFDVYGYMMVGNPSMQVIQSYIDKYKPVTDQSSGLSEYKG